MKASEAKELTNDFLHKIPDFAKVSNLIFKKVKGRAEKGYYYLELPSKIKVESKLLLLLKNKGFKVDREWSFLKRRYNFTISWGK